MEKLYYYILLPLLPMFKYSRANGMYLLPQLFITFISFFCAVIFIDSNEKYEMETVHRMYLFLFMQMVTYLIFIRVDKFDLTMEQLKIEAQYSKEKAIKNSIVLLSILFLLIGIYQVLT